MENFKIKEISYLIKTIETTSSQVPRKHIELLVLTDKHNCKTRINLEVLYSEDENIGYKHFALKILDHFPKYIFPLWNNTERTIWSKISQKLNKFIDNTLGISPNLDELDMFILFLTTTYKTTRSY